MEIDERTVYYVKVLDPEGMYIPGVGSRFCGEFFEFEDQAVAQQYVDQCPGRLDRATDDEVAALTAKPEPSGEDAGAGGEA